MDDVVLVQLLPFGASNQDTYLPARCIGQTIRDGYFPTKFAQFPVLFSTKIFRRSSQIALVVFP